jgi:hypothetical protein
MGNSGDQLPLLKALPAALLSAALATAAPAFAADCPTGRFYANAGPDVASGLEISPSGRFQYMLSEGAVDEGAEGRWKCRDGVLLLTTQPQPKPAEFKLKSISKDAEAPFSLVVTWPDGNGIPAVDFQLQFAEGESVSGYTQSSGWSRDLEGRRPTAIRVSEPFFGTVSPVIPLPDQDHIRVTIVLTPNDMGVADFRETRLTNEGGNLVLHWRGRDIAYHAAGDD